MPSLQELLIAQDQPTPTDSVAHASVAGPVIDERVGYFFPVSVVVQDVSAATAANYGVFYTAPFPLEVIEAWETHKTAGSNGGAVTLGIEKLTGGVVLDSGVATLSSLFNLKQTANDPNRIPGHSSMASRNLNPGDRLALVDAGTLTDLAHVEVTVLLRAINYHLSTVNNP